MDVEFEIEPIAEQREGAEPASAPAPRGRPWVKGQCGNPAGRPRQAHTTGIVADYLIGRKTIPLTKKLVALALDGDRTALRLCLERIAPPRREPPDWLGLPLIEDRADLRALMTAVNDAAVKGAITPAQ